MLQSILVVDAEIMALDEIVAEAILLGLLETPAQSTLDEITAEVDITAELLIVEEPLTFEYETEAAVGADNATKAVAAIIALEEIVAEAINVGLLVTFDQSTELALFECSEIIALDEVIAELEINALEDTVAEAMLVG